MAVTQGHGNPNWTRDEVTLALELYFECDGSVPGSSDPRVKALSELLRAFPYHSSAARKRNRGQVLPFAFPVDFVILPPHVQTTEN